jgi:hypothetical protein
MTPRFEDRLLRSLHGMVDTLPPTAGGPRPDRRGRRRAVLTSAAVSGVAAAAAVAVGAVLVSVPGTPTSGDAAPTDVPAPGSSTPPGATPSVQVPVVEDGMILLARTGPGGPIEISGPDEVPRTDVATVLREAGVDVEVLTTAGSPSLVGTCDGISADVGPGMTESEDRWLIDPAVYTGLVSVSCVRAPEPGERIEVYGNAFATGEPLAGVTCELEWPFTAEALADAAGDTGVTLRFATGELAFEVAAAMAGASEEEAAAILAEEAADLGIEPDDAGRIVTEPPAGYVGAAQGSADGVLVAVEPNSAAVPSETELATTGFAARDC